MHMEVTFCPELECVLLKAALSVLRTATIQFKRIETAAVDCRSVCWVLRSSDLDPVRTSQMVVAKRSNNNWRSGSS